LFCALVTASALAIGSFATGLTPAADALRKRSYTRRLAPTQSTVAPDLTATIRAEADWILTAQLPDGAIAHYPDKVRVWPYLASYASVGLTRATAVTGDARYVRASWKWLTWYQAHQSSEGFVTDYTVNNSVLTSTGDMDSTDAYAGMFLYAAWTAYEQTRDRAALKSLKPGILRAVKAIDATMDADGLTWAKPAWQVKYLMDEAEVYIGLRAASKLLQVLKEPSASSAAAKAQKLKTAIDATWNGATGAYDWAIHSDGARESTTWTTLYPDALQQVWAAALGVASSAHAEEVTNRFQSVHPYWNDPVAVKTNAPDIEQYWPVAGWGMSPSVRDQAARSISAAAVAAGRGWPYTPATAGQVIVLASGGPQIP
jgi:hypothetical protein